MKAEPPGFPVIFPLTGVFSWVRALVLLHPDHWFCHTNLRRGSRLELEKACAYNITAERFLTAGTVLVVQVKETAPRALHSEPRGEPGFQEHRYLYSPALTSSPSLPHGVKNTVFRDVCPIRGRALIGWPGCRCWCALLETNPPSPLAA